MPQAFFENPNGIREGITCTGIIITMIQRTFLF